MKDSRESEFSQFKQFNASFLSHTQASPYQHSIPVSHSADPSKVAIEKVKIPHFASEKKSVQETTISKELPEANPLLFGSGIENVSFFQPTQSLYPLSLIGCESQGQVALKKNLQPLDSFSDTPLESTKDVSFNICLQQQQQQQQPPQQPCQLVYKKQEKQVTVNLTTLKATLNSKSSPIISQFYSSNSSNLQFESRFESGNLASVSKLEHNTYSLTIQQDVNTRGYTQWFYFRVTNQKKEQNVKFILGKFYKKNSLFQHGMKVSVFSQRLLENDGIQWHKSGDSIRYYSEEEARMKNNCTINKTSEKYLSQSEPLNLEFELNNFINEQPKNNKNTNTNDPNNLINPEGQPNPPKPSYLLEFEYSFERENDTTYFAYSVPYTYQHLQKYLQKLLSKSYESLTIRPLCASLLGNDLYILTITNPKTPLKKLRDEQKMGIFLTARVHPGETVSSFIIEGFINFLLGQTKEAMSLKDQFVFKIVPMLNPDGVVVGNYRCSIAGCDLNRRWMNPSEEYHPEIFYVKKTLFEFNQKYPVMAYCDLHGHSKKQGFFVYGCQEDKVKEDNEKEFTTRSSQVTELPYLLGKLTSWFETVNCNYSMVKSKESTSRQTVFRELQIPESFTMEASFFGPAKKFDCQQASIQFTEDDYRHMGECLGKSIWQKFGPQNEEFLGEFRKENMELSDDNSRIDRRNNKSHDVSSGSDSDPSGDNLDEKELGLSLPVEKQPKKKKKKATLTGIRRLLMTSYYSHSPPRTSNKQERKDQSNTKEQSKANKQNNESSTVEKQLQKTILNSTHKKFSNKETTKDGIKSANYVLKKSDNKNLGNTFLKVTNQHEIVNKDKILKETAFDEQIEQQQQQTCYASSPTLNPIKLKMKRPLTENYNFKMLENDSFSPKIEVNGVENDTRNISNTLSANSNRNNNILNVQFPQTNISSLSESKSFMIVSSFLSSKSSPKKCCTFRKKSNLQTDESQDNSAIKQQMDHAVCSDFIENSFSQIKGNFMENSRSQNQDFSPLDSVLLHTKQRALSDASKKCCSPIHTAFSTVPVNRSKVIDLSGSQQSESLQKYSAKVSPNKQEQIFQSNSMIQQRHLDYGNSSVLFGDVSPGRIVISQQTTSHLNEGKRLKQQENSSDDQVRKLLSKMNSTFKDFSYVQSKINKLNETQHRCKTDGDMSETTPSHFRNHFNNYSTIISSDQRFDGTAGEFQRNCSSNHTEHKINETAVQLCRKTRSYSYKPKQSFMSNLQKIRSGQVACNKNINDCFLDQQFVSYKIPNVRFSEQKSYKKIDQSCPFSANEHRSYQVCPNKKQSISSSRSLMIKSIKLKTPQLKNLSPRVVKLVSPNLINCLQEIVPQKSYHHVVAQSSSSFSKNRERSISNQKVAAGNGIKEMSSFLK